MTKITNKNKKPQENPEYFYVVHVGKNGCTTHLMLTEHEFKKAKARAERNPEDLPLYSIAVQVVNEKSKENL